MRVGITGPSELTLNEERFVADTMYDFLMDTEPAVIEFWSGCAFGVDSIGIAAALRARVPVLGLTIPTGAWHNENLVRELRDRKREYGDYEYELQIKATKEYPNINDAYMPRNDLTVASIEVLVAFPPNSREPAKPRGGRGAGTWATVRRARKQHRDIYFYPLDGSATWSEESAARPLL